MLELQQKRLQTGSGRACAGRGAAQAEHQSVGRSAAAAAGLPTVVPATARKALAAKAQPMGVIAPACGLDVRARKVGGRSAKCGPPNRDV